MKIALISTCWSKTPPTDGYGGTEWVVSYLAEQLVELGHDVTLFATGNSETKADKWYWYDEPTPDFLINDEIVHVTKAYEFIRQSNFDFIHNHTYHVGPALLSLSDMPSVSTFHVGYHPKMVNFYKAFCNLHGMVSISLYQQQLMPTINWVGNVHNSVNVADFDFSAKKEEYLLFIGIIAEHKGPHLAIRAARAFRRPLIIAGPTREYAREFLEREILPYVDGDQIKYVGEVNFEQKVKLYKNASALLVPISRDEPFGMVMIESLACGTPVIAFRKGAVPEIIVDGQVGFVVEEGDELVSAIQKLDRISPYKCRDHVEHNFNARGMAEKYLQMYEKVIRSHKGQKYIISRNRSIYPHWSF